jgi:hypothetical protein
MKRISAPQQKMKRTILNKYLWESVIAIVKYIPKSFTVKQLHGLDFYKPSKINEFKSRVELLSPDSVRQWGTMTPDQMMHHLNLAFGSPLGYYDLPDESYFLSRTLFKWILIDWFPEQPVGLRLPLNFKIPPDQHFDFKFEQQRFLEILDKAGQTKSADDWGPHCYVGKLSYKEWGKLALIHIDYHLRQFGV